MIEREIELDSVYGGIWDTLGNKFADWDFSESRMIDIFEQWVGDIDTVENWFSKIAIKIFCMDNKVAERDVTEKCKRELESGYPDLFEKIMNKLIEEIDVSAFPPEDSGYYYDERSEEWKHEDDGNEGWRD